MLLVERFEHPQFTSNTYLLRHSFYNEVYLVDAGYTNPVFDCLLTNQKIVGVFITHPHYDHIYDINRLIEKYPECRIYCSEESINGLRSDKENLSFYHDNPIIYNGDNIVQIQDKDRIILFDNIWMDIIHTPGHHPGSLTYLVNPYLFTGDSYIPGYNVVTKLKGGSKLESDKSIELISKMMIDGTLLCPGHFDILRIWLEF